MGMFDSIGVYMVCPYCNHYSHIDCQTKDLDNALWNFKPLSEDWWTGSFLERNFFKDAPVRRNVPYDKEHEAWDSIAERTEAYARVSDEHMDLPYVNVICECMDCKNNQFFNGKIRIQDGYLIGSIYDIDTKE